MSGALAVSLDPVYPFLFLDAVHVAVDGTRDILGLGPVTAAKAPGGKGPCHAQIRLTRR